MSSTKMVTCTTHCTLARECREDILLLLKERALRVCAAKGTEIQNLGRKFVELRGVTAETGRIRSVGTQQV